MTNHSFYEDVDTILSTLDRVQDFKETNEVMLESYALVESLVEEFNTLLEDVSISYESIKFKQLYDKLTSAYIAAEKLFSAVDKKCRVICRNRDEVSRLAFTLLDSRSTVLKSNISQIMELPSYVISELRTFYSESRTIGFYLNIGEYNSMQLIREFVGDLQ